jgi:hypothetical protein
MISSALEMPFNETKAGVSCRLQRGQQLAQKEDPFTDA